MSVEKAAPWLALAAAAGAALGFGTLALAGAERGRALVVESEPAGASVFVDGVFRGVTPLGPERVSPGGHSVRLEKSGFRTMFAPADASGGQDIRRVRLEPVPTGGLDVRSRPAGAEVYLDGVFRGLTPLSLGDLRPGPRTVRVEKTNHKPASASVVVPPGGRAAQEFELADRVLEFLEQAVDAEPDKVLSYMELGHYLVVKNEVERGMKVYRQGLMVGGDRLIRALRSGEGNAGLIEQERKRIEQQIQKDCHLPALAGPKVQVLAVAVRKEMEDLYPKKVFEALTRAGQLVAGGKAGAGADAVAEIAREVPQNPLLWSCLASLRMRAGEREAAIDALVEGFKALGGGAEGAVRLAEECLADPGLSEDAEAAGQVLDLCARELARLGEAAENDAALALARLEIRILRKASRRTRALERVEELLPLETDPEGRALLELEKGRILASMGRAADARAAFEKIAKEAPSAGVRDEARRELAEPKEP